MGFEILTSILSQSLPTNDCDDLVELVHMSVCHMDLRIKVLLNQTTNLKKVIEGIFTKISPYN